MKWDSRFDEGPMLEAALAAAREVGYAFDVPVEDLEQEARILLGTQADYYQRLVDSQGISYARWAVRSRLVKFAKADVDQRGGRYPAPLEADLV